MLPNFLIVGAARSGTSSLYSYLQQHPQIYLPASKRPEPHFFFKDSVYAKGIEYYEKTWFPGVIDKRAVGEASTSYLFGPQVPERITKHLPGVRLIAMLRNPIERAFSNYWHSVKSGVETLDFASAIDREEERTALADLTPLGEAKPYAYVGRGFYYRQLSRFLSFIERERMAILLLEDLCGDTAQCLRSLYRFLDVDPDRLPGRLDLIENRSVPDGAVFDLELRQRLTKIYADDVQHLGKLLGRDLSHWLG